MSAQSMLSAVFEGEGALRLCERPIPAVEEPEDVLIEVEGCGICGTDLHILDVPPGHPATPGIILGHEYLGRVVEVGEGVRHLRPGTRVAIAPNLNCGLCRFCRRGLVNHCQQFTTLGIFQDGGLARFNVAPERACFPIRDEVPFEEAVWAEVLSCVTCSIDNVSPLPGETAVVIGAGPVGALHGMLLAASGVDVIASDLNPGRLELLSRLGIRRTVDLNQDDLGGVVARELDMGADIVIDAVGTQLDLAVEIARVGGRISLFGMDSQARPQVHQNSITRKEITVFGSYVGANRLPRAIAILESGVIRPSALISEVYRLSEIEKALQQLRQGRIMKAVVRH